MNELKLTVKDVLERDLFKYAKVIAGKKGLDRKVRWSHILEVKEFESLINGGELILTTGVGLQLDLPTQLMYVKKLIEKGAACICIEMGSYFIKVPIELIKLADEHDFPIIVFEKIVKFVDISQDLHTLIVNQHHKMLYQLDKLSREFIELSLSSNGILKILKELHHYFQQSILFITDSVKPYYYPAETKELEESIRNYLDSSNSSSAEKRFFIIDKKTFALMPVRGLGQVWGNLCLEVKESLPDEFLFLVLDRAALAIAQILLRNRTIEERKQNLEDELVRNLLNGQSYEIDDFQTFLPSASRNLHYRIFLIQMNYAEMNWSENDWEEIKLQRSMIIRSLFKHHGFFPAVSSKRSEIAVIASFIAADHLKQETGRFHQIIDSIMETNENNFINGEKCTFGISTVYKDISEVTRGYEEAGEVLKLHGATTLKSHFYEDLGAYRILLPLKKNGYLESYIHDHLGPLIDYDKKTESDLLETLSVYLEHMGSKKEAAERLFIVRQTLYHRIEKLQQLLGNDFMEPANRLALEIAIKAHDLVRGQTVEKKKATIAP